MRSKMQLFLLLTMVCFITDCHKPISNSKADGNAGKDSISHNVILVVIDGPRYTETWGDSSHALIPFIAQKVASQGVVATKFFNNGYTWTCSGHAALTTGFYESLNNSGAKDHPSYPSFLQYWLRKTGAPKEKAWIITSKDKLENLSNTKHADWSDRYLPSVDCGKAGIGTGYRDDKVTLDSLFSKMNRHQPSLILVNFKEPDVSGHRKDWSAYLKGIKDTDEYVEKIWSYVQNTPYYKDRTTLLITNDHGRHLDHIKEGFAEHGDDCAGCRHINFFALGPMIKKGYVTHIPYEQIDIPVTITYLLRTELPDAKGRIMTDILEHH